MRFPFGINYSVELNVGSAEMLVPLVVEKIAVMLSELSAEQVFVEGSTIRFRSGLWVVRWNWHLLSLIGSGQLRVEGQGDRLTVSYRLSQIHLLVGLAAIVGFLLVVSWPDPKPILFLSPFIVAAHVAQYAITFARFSNWLQCGLEDMPQIRKLRVLA